MFYKKVNKNNNKDMFEFLKEHYEYYTLSSWNGLKSIANNVKVYNLGLDYEILELLQVDNYFTINDTIETWEIEHKGYSVGFNGRMGGYLVLYNENNNGNVLDYYVENNDSYEDFKEDIKNNYGGLKYYHDSLVEQVEIVQSFDKLTDELVEICKDMLENCKIVEKEKQETITYKELVWECE